MLDKIFNKKKKEQDIMTLPERKNPLDLKTLPKLGPKALQEIVIEEQKYISILVAKIEQIKGEYQKVNDKAEELREKNDVINAQVLKMSNEHEQLTIKFDNLQNSLEVMISTTQEQLNNQLSFIKSFPQSLSSSEILPKTIDQVFALYQDRFELCSKIGQQNKFLKEKITEIELRFDEIKERYEEAEKEKGFNSLIPELMVSLEELKRERRDLGEGKKLAELENKVTGQKQSRIGRQAETMTSDKIFESPNTSQHSSSKSLPAGDCLACKQHTKQLKNLNQVKITLMQQVGEWSSKCQALAMQLQQSQEQLSTLLEQKQSMQTLIHQLNENVNLLTKENQKQSEEFRLKNLTLEDSLQRLTEQNRNLSLEIETGILKLSAKQAELTALNIKLAQVPQSQQESSQQDHLGQAPQISSTKVYEEQIKSLTLQHSLAQQQIAKLKHQSIAHSAQISRLVESLQKSELELSKTRESLIHSQEMANSIEQKYKKLIVENEQALMDKVRSLELMRGENEKELIYLRNFKVSSEQEAKKVSGAKKQLEEQIYQLSAFKSEVETRILPNLRSELESTKRQLQRISEQKSMIQQNGLQNINQLNNNYQFLLNQKETLSNEKSHLQLTLTQLQKQSQIQKQEIETFSQMIQRLNQEMTDKMLQIQTITDQYKSKSNETNELYEELRSKQRKYESELNQERIRLETMKRTISVQQTKLQQNEKSSNKFYEESMHKDKKISYMEVKLKEYKHLIQSLKKEKEEVQKTYIEKIKTYEESIAEVVSEEEDTERKRKAEERGDGDRQRSESFSTDKDAEYFRNQLLAYEQSNLVLKQQNETLRGQMKELEQELQDRKRQVEGLQQKRQQTLKQLEKLNLRSINGALQQPFLQKEKQYLREREQFEAYREKTEQRMKKIALKAYKGFDILLKRHHNLYKEFMAVFVKEIADREEVKNIESEINMLVNKSTDMKDVFQDYI